MDTSSMRAAVLTGDGFELHAVDVPAPQAGELLIKTAACGVCSGDVFVYRHRETYAATYNRLGHEASGVVAAVGPGVTDFGVGDVVTALALPAYSDYFIAPAAAVAKLPPAVDPAYAVGEAIACCVHAANRFGTRPGDRVAVIGCGFMGLICLQLARYQGAGHIIAVDPVAERREMGVQMGAAAAYDPVAAAAEAILAAEGEFDLVIEAAGVQSAIDLSTTLVAQHGRIVLVGYHQSNNGQRTVNMEQWNYKAIDVVNGHVRREDEKVAALRQGMALLADGHLDTAPLVTFYPLTAIERAFRDLSSGAPGLFKAVMIMNEGDT